jgi:hypothetical protein
MTRAAINRHGRACLGHLRFDGGGSKTRTMLGHVGTATDLETGTDQTKKKSTVHA